MIEQGRIREGMTVYSAEGEKLGKVIACEASTFIIEKGFFFPKDYVARFEDVVDVRGEEIHLSRGREALGVAGIARQDGAFSEGSSVMGPGGGIETAPARDEALEVRRRPVATGARFRAERPAEQRAASAEEDPPVSFGEDSGALDSTRREPEE